MTQTILVLTTFVILLVVYFVEARTETELSVYVVPDQYEDRLLDMDRKAIETAYKEQIAHLFIVWMKDATGQPQRAVKGVNSARKAYVDSMEEINRRERARQK